MHRGQAPHHRSAGCMALQSCVGSPGQAAVSHIKSWQAPTMVGCVLWEGCSRRKVVVVLHASHYLTDTSLASVFIGGKHICITLKFTCSFAWVFRAGTSRPTPLSLIPRFVGSCLISQPRSGDDLIKSHIIATYFQVPSTVFAAGGAVTVVTEVRLVNAAL